MRCIGLPSAGCLGWGNGGARDLAGETSADWDIVVGRCGWDDWLDWGGGSFGLSQSDGHGNCGGAVWGGGGGRRTESSHGLNWSGRSLAAGAGDWGGWVVVVWSRGAGGGLAGGSRAGGGHAGGDWVVVVCSRGGGALDGGAALGAAHWVVIVFSSTAGGWLDRAGGGWLGRAGADGRGWVVVVLSSGGDGSGSNEEDSVTHVD